MRWVDLKARRRTEELQEELEKLKRTIQNLELEWSNTYDKLSRMMGRVAKRAAVVESAHVTGETGEADAPAVPGTGAAFPALNPRQRTIQSQILSRRRGGNGGVQ